jgi:hypothetical protein
MFAGLHVLQTVLACRTDGRTRAAVHRAFWPVGQSSVPPLLGPNLSAGSRRVLEPALSLPCISTLWRRRNRHRSLVSWASLEVGMEGGIALWVMSHLSAVPGGPSGSITGPSSPVFASPHW